MIKSKNHDFSSNSKNMEVKPSFFTFKARLAFTKLRQIFVKALIFYYFNPKCHIQIEINISKYAINRILSQLILDNLD